MIQAGNIVKIVRNGERFWVIVKRVTRQTVYGIIDSWVFMQPKLRRGSLVKFHKDEIIDLWVDKVERDHDIDKVVKLFESHGYTVKRHK